MREQDKELEREIGNLELQTEKLDQVLDKEQKKALIRKAKKAYGRDWKAMLFGAAKAVGSVRMNPEKAHDLYGMGIGDEKDLRVGRQRR